MTLKAMLKSLFDCLVKPCRAVTYAGNWQAFGLALSIDNYRAVVTYDPDADMLRGEFLGLNGGADFYASDIPTLKAGGAKSLAIFLDVCREKGIDPVRHFSGRFN